MVEKVLSFMGPKNASEISPLCNLFGKMCAPRMVLGHFLGGSKMLHGEIKDCCRLKKRMAGCWTTTGHFRKSIYT